MASLLGRIVCSVRAGSAPVFGATAVVRGLCSAAALKRVPVLSPSVSLCSAAALKRVPVLGPSVSLQSSSCLIPR